MQLRAWSAGLPSKVQNDFCRSLRSTRGAAGIGISISDKILLRTRILSHRTVQGLVGNLMAGPVCFERTWACHEIDVIVRLIKVGDSV